MIALESHNRFYYEMAMRKIWNNIQGLVFRKMEQPNNCGLKHHNMPPEKFICWHCAVYLLWSSIFPRGIRIYHDEDFLKGSNPYLGRFSRYSAVSRKFDIKYGFLDDKTNLY